MVICTLLMSQGEESSGPGSSRKWQTRFFYSGYVEAGKGEMNLTSFSALDPHDGRSSRLVSTHRTIHSGTSVCSLPHSSRALVGISQKYIYIYILRRRPTAAVELSPKGVFMYLSTDKYSLAVSE
jgi:hypothetical protein